ncbi:MAG: DUF975 family protein, partial [Clostridia bacterium]|nr:DUF975 family protein [Clostridia bacterium]
MNNKTSFYKEKAIALLTSKYQKPIITLLIFVIINAIITAISTATGPVIDYADFTTSPARYPFIYFLIGIVSFVVGALITYALQKMYIRIARDENYEVEEILKTTYGEEPVRSFVISLLMSIYIFLWSLLLIIPGIIKTYAYSMSMYIANKDLGLSASLCITKSNELTSGHKFRIFLIDLSFLGWYLLSILTFGI